MERMLASHPANASKNALLSMPPNLNPAHSTAPVCFAISRKFWFISVPVRIRETFFLCRYWRFTIAC